MDKKLHKLSQKKIDRREFIKDVSIAGLGLAAGPALLDMSARKSAAQDGMSKVVIASHPDAVTGVRVDTNAAQEMVDACIMNLTGVSDVGGAWESVLPGLSPDDLITIKVNCINSSLATHPQVVDAITEGLIAAGVEPNNIIIWDRTNHELTNCGYKRNTEATGVRCFGTNQGGWGYDKQIKPGGRSTRLSKILTSTDHLINVPVLKDHSIAGATLGMKNHYGSVDNPGALHGGSCNPFIPELNDVSEIKDKTRVTVLDACLGIYRGGPHGQPQFKYNSIIMSEDPVALDYQGWKILDEERKKHGQSLAQPNYIKTAAEMGLGTNDPDKIHVEMVDAKTQAVRAAGKLSTTWGAIKL